MLWVVSWSKLGIIKECYPPPPQEHNWTLGLFIMKGLAGGHSLCWTRGIIQEREFNSGSWESLQELVPLFFFFFFKELCGICPWHSVSRVNWSWCVCLSSKSQSHPILWWLRINSWLLHRAKQISLNFLLQCETSGHCTKETHLTF